MAVFSSEAHSPHGQLHVPPNNQGCDSGVIVGCWIKYYQSHKRVTLDPLLILV